MRNLALAAAVALAQAAAAQPRVAIVAAAANSITAGQFVDSQAKIMGTGLFSAVDIIPVFSGQPVPTLPQLQQYDAVITWSNTPYNDPAALGDVLADYVDAGGGVVVTIFANTNPGNLALAGRWVTGGYEIIPSGGGNTNSGGAQSIGAIHIPGHPILAGVNTFNGGTTSWRPTTTSLSITGIKVAEWTDGKTLAAVSTKFPGRADLGMYPPSSDFVSTWWVSSTDGARLMANALLYTMGSGTTCYADCDGDGALTLADFGCFQTKFALGDLYADCNQDQVLNLADFGCFQTAFALGCP